MAFDTFSNPEAPEPQPSLPSNTPDLDDVKPEGVTPTSGLVSTKSTWLQGGRGILIGMGLGMTLAIGGMTFFARPKQPTTAPTEQVTTVAGQSVSVETVKLTAIDQTFPTQGTVEAREWVSVMPKASGVQVKEIRVDEGQRVEAGQTIAVLDNSVQQDRLEQAQAQAVSAQAQVASAETQLESARAQQQSAQAQLDSAKAAVEQKRAKLGQQQAALAEAESNFRRYQDLANQGVISRQDLESRSTAAVTARESVRVAQADIASAQADVGRAQAGMSQAQAGVNQAQAGVQNARAQMQNAIARVGELKTQRDQATIVQAPASGIIAKKNVKVGDLTGNTPLFSIQQNGALELQAKVPETLLSKVRPGATAQITSDADQKLQLQGRVREINPVVDEKTRQAIVKIDLPANLSLKPGMFLKAAITFESTQAISVPTDAVLAQGEQKMVYVLDRDVVRSRVVQVGEPNNGRLIVKSGLKPDEQIVVAGAGFLKDGDRVTVVK